MEKCFLNQDLFVLVTLIQVAMWLMAKTYADITRVHVEIMKSVLATSFVGSVMKISLTAPTVAENPIPVVKIIQVQRTAALIYTNAILMRETAKMTVTVPEFSNVVIVIVVTTFQMGPIVVNSQVPLKEVSFCIILSEFTGFATVHFIKIYQFVLSISHDKSF